MDFKRFTLTHYLEKGSVPSVYAKPKDSLDTDDLFLKKSSLDVSLGPYRETSVFKVPLLPKKNRFLFRLGRPVRNMLSIF